MAKTKYYSRGKLLITSEYAVVKGAKAIAVPTKYGQELTVTTGRGSDIVWESYDHEGNRWFKAKVSLFDFSVIKSDNDELANKISDILQNAVRLNSDFLSTWKGVKVVTKLDFPRHWGLGSSSTLIRNVALWADVDPYELYQKTFGGSGYDIACAEADSPIMYQLGENGPEINKINLPSSFLDRALFFYSGQKTSSQEALSYIETHEIPEATILKLSKLSESLSTETNLAIWQELLQKHNEELEKYLNQNSNNGNFQGYAGVIKPLGAWGGDFMLALGENNPDFFKEKGIDTIIPAREILYLGEES